MNGHDGNYIMFDTHFVPTLSDEMSGKVFFRNVTKRIDVDFLSNKISYIKLVYKKIPLKLSSKNSALVIFSLNQIFIQLFMKFVFNF